MQPDMTIQGLAATQGGVIARQQAIAAGLSDYQVDARLRSRRWHRVAVGYYRVFNMDSRLDLLRAAVVVLPRAVGSHFSAAAIHGIDKIDTSQVTVLVHSRTTHNFPGVRVFRCHDLDADHVVLVDGIPTTTVARTVVDLAPWITQSHLGVVVDDVVAARSASIVSIRSVLESVARRGKPGVRALRGTLDERLGDDRSVSVLERAGNKLLVQANIHDFETEFPIPWSPDRRFDVAFVRCRVAIEWDSRRWHTLERAFQSDRQRDREAVLHGWRILRFTWEDVHVRPEMVTRTVRTLVAH